MCAQPATRTTAVYFRNIRRGPIGAIRQALRYCLPSWPLLGLGFVGESILEVITDDRLSKRLTGTHKLMGISHVPQFDIYECAPSPEQVPRDSPNQKRIGIELVIRRMKANLRVTLNSFARSWYESTLQSPEELLHQHSTTVEHINAGVRTDLPEPTVAEDRTVSLDGTSHNGEEGCERESTEKKPANQEDITMSDSGASAAAKNSHENGSTQQPHGKGGIETTNQ